MNIPNIAEKKNKDEFLYPGILFFKHTAMDRLFADVNDLMLWLRLRGAYALEQELRHRSRPALESIEKRVAEENKNRINLKEKWEYELKKIDASEITAGDIIKGKTVAKDLFGPQPIKQTGFLKWMWDKLTIW